MVILHDTPSRLVGTGTDRSDFRSVKRRGSVGTTMPQAVGAEFDGLLPIATRIPDDPNVLLASENTCSTQALPIQG
jgi:hypothetical protein